MRKGKQSRPLIPVPDVARLWGVFAYYDSTYGHIGSIIDVCKSAERREDTARELMLYLGHSHHDWHKRRCACDILR